MTLTTEQSKNVQVLRGLAIIAVVFLHSTPSGLAQVFCRPFLNFAVGLFLFLSGMLSSADRWNPRKRISKVAIPYLLWTFIYTVMRNMGTPGNIPRALLLNVLTGNAAAVMYYIFVYCEFTLLIPLMDKLARSRFKYLGFVITPVEILLTRTLPLITGREIHPYISILMSLSCLSWFTYFYLGYLLGNQYLSVKIGTKKVAVFWMLSILLQFAEGYFYYTLGDENCGTQLKLTSILTGVLFALLAYHYVCNGKDRSRKVLKLLGDHSFGIYFSHIAVIMVLGFIPGYAQYVIYPINAVIAVVLTTFFVLLGKKVLGKFGKYLAL